MLRNCERCGGEFEARSADVGKGFGRFCSRECGHPRLRVGRENAWRWFHPKQKRWYRKWRESDGRKVYTQAESRWVWERSNGPIPEGHEIHHKDHDPSNNDLSNLECVTAEWHDDYHQRLREDHVIIDGVEHRRCQNCREYRPTDQFHVRSAGTYSGYCKPCSVAYLRDWRRSNKRHFNAYMLEWNTRPKYPKRCEFCGVDYLAKRTPQRFCGKSCSSKHRQQSKRNQSAQ